MKRITGLLLNSYLLALWVAVIILVIFPVNIENGNGEYLNDNKVHFADPDNDGNSESIAFFHNGLGGAALTVYNINGVIDQWCFRGRYDFELVTGVLLTGDYDKISIKEVYTFTLSGDSLLFRAITDFRLPHSGFRNKFITRVGRRNGKSDPYLFSKSRNG